MDLAPAKGDFGGLSLVAVLADNPIAGWTWTLTQNEGFV